MIDFETYHEVRRCRDELRLNPVQNAAKLGLDIKTVRKWLAKKRYAPRRRPARRCGKLDPFKPTILAWLEKHPYSGAQILQRLRVDHGNNGGKSVLNDYLRTVRPEPVACNVRRRNEMGSVESAIGYIQKNFPAGLEISPLLAPNAEARRWS